MTNAAPIRSAAVLGAGVMGAQIAAHLANAGIRVHLLDLAGPDHDRNAPSNKALAALKKQSPAPLYHPDALRLIQPGNFDDHLPRLADVDWIIEAVVERMDIKHSLLARVEDVVRDDCIVSTNTSGLSVNQIAEGRSENFRRHFLGTHFFNPPRYQRLLELIPTADTAPSVLTRIRNAGEKQLGKGIVQAKDTPDFIGNRIGIYALMTGVHAWDNDIYSIEAIDAITGPLIGRPRSATFRTADVVGLDVLAYVAGHLYEAVPDDESRDCFRLPDWVGALVKAGHLGAKTKKGFYQKSKGQILSINPATDTYEAAKPINLPDLAAVKKAGALPDRLRALYNSDGPAGQFFKRTMLDILAYSARRIPEITENPADIDRALRWGFAWELGPFEIWDELGFPTVLNDLKAANIYCPTWVDELASQRDSIYARQAAHRSVYMPSQQAFAAEEVAPHHQLQVASISARPDALVEDFGDAALLDAGDQVLLYEFRSKAHAIGKQVIDGFFTAMERVETGDYRGLIVANDGPMFSAGANLAEIASKVQDGRFDDVRAMVARFQAMGQRIRYAAKPVVVSVQGRALGGGCEIAMAANHVVADAESYVGLVELGVGVIPAGGGTMRMAARASQLAPSKASHHVLPFLQSSFETIAMAKVATSAVDAVAKGLLPANTEVMIDGARRLHAAHSAVVHLSERGYVPPAKQPFLVLGEPAAAVFQSVAYNMVEGRFISDYDRVLADTLASVITGGALSGPTWVDEDYLLELELEAFMSLLGNEKTQARIASILTTNKPLRN